MGLRVLLDMDPGIDDALALILALRSEELDVSAVTTVSGNVSVDKTTRNALAILDFLSCDVPVAMGMRKPLVGGSITAEDVHGKDGLGNINLPQPARRPLGINASDLIVEQALSSKKGELTLIATGPLTNVAAAITKEPEVTRRVGQVVSMGGAFAVTPYGHGNYSAVAEFNVASDPEAARIVYNSGMKIKAVGLDVTMNPSACLNRRHYERILDAKTRTAHLAGRMMKNLFEMFSLVALHDPLAVAAAFKPSLVKTERFHVDVETLGELTRGMTVVDRGVWLRTEPRGKPNVNVCVDVDGPSFLKLFMERVIFS